MQVVVNNLYPAQIQLILSSSGPTLGPLKTASGVMFDPRGHLAVFLDGALTTVADYSYDATNDQYLISLDSAIASGSLVQVNYSLPEDPFLDSTSATFPGFAVVATVTTGIISATPTEIGVSLPAATNPPLILSPVASAPVFDLPIAIGFSPSGLDATVSFYASGTVAYVRIQGTSSVANGGFGTGFGFFGYPWTSDGGDTYSYDSGMVAVTGAYGSVVVPGLIPAQTVDLTITAYDSSETPIPQGSGNLEIPFVIQVVSPVASGAAQWTFYPPDGAGWGAVPYSGIVLTSTVSGSTILLAVETMDGSSQAQGSITDTQGNTWTFLGISWSSGNAQMMEVWIARGIVGGPLTVTYTNPDRTWVTQVIAGALSGVTGVRGAAFNTPTSLGGTSPTGSVSTGTGDQATLLASAPLPGSHYGPWANSNSAFTDVAQAAGDSFAKGYVSRFIVDSPQLVSNYADVIPYSLRTTANNALVVLTGNFV